MRQSVSIYSAKYVTDTLQWFSSPRLQGNDIGSVFTLSLPASDLLCCWPLAITTTASAYQRAAKVLKNSIIINNLTLRMALVTEEAVTSVQSSPESRARQNPIIQHLHSRRAFRCDEKGRESGEHAECVHKLDKLPHSISTRLLRLTYSMCSSFYLHSTLAVSHFVELGTWVSTAAIITGATEQAGRLADRQ